MTILRPYLLLLLLIFAGMQGCRQKGALPDLKETYQYKDAKPFGAKVAFDLMKTVFPSKFININKKSFSDFSADTYIDTGSFYISISKRFYCTQDDAAALLKFVKEGNSALISAAYIDTVLLDRVDCRQEHNEWGAAAMFMNTRYAEGTLSATDQFSYFYHPFQNNFSAFDSSAARVLGRNQSGQPNLMVLFHGKGRLYLQCEPRAFSNYFLLTQNNYRYLEQVMQYSREGSGNIFWDDFYNRKYSRGKEGETSALAILFQYPELTMAFWILVFLLLLYIFFNGKRKQRIIPIIKPVENTSVAFTQAIPGLYLAEKNNKTIADKMITYFNDHIRNRYFLSSHGSGKDFVQTLSKKAGLSFESVQALYNTIEQVQLTEEVSDFELLTLNEQIQQFYKNRN